MFPGSAPNRIPCERRSQEWVGLNCIGLADCWHLACSRSMNAFSGLRSGACGLSSENLHLFYRVRGSYGEHRPLADAPGHLFLKHEINELTTFIELALLCGWDFYLFPAPAYAAAFVSHDEYIEFHTNDSNAANAMKDSLAGSVVQQPG
jgi:hypothetical protein